MTPFIIAFIVKPLFICLLFGAAVGIAKIVMRFIPETMKAMIKGVIIRESYVWCLIVHNFKGQSE